MHLKKWHCISWGISRDFQISQRLFYVQGCCFATFFRNHSLYVFDWHSRNSVGVQTTSGTSVLLKSLSDDHLSAYIHQCYICNVGDGSNSNRELQYEIQFVKVSTTRPFFSESFMCNIIKNLKQNITVARKILHFQIFLRKVKIQIVWNALFCLQNQG